MRGLMVSNMKSPIKIIAYLSVFLLFTSFLSVDLVGQGNPNPEESINSTKREEVQRYFGYELLLYRYLSLPYDASINVNQSGNFVDIGLVFIVFFPLLLLIGASRNKLSLIMSSFYLFFTWIISTSNSFIFSPSKQKINSGVSEIDAYLSQVTFGHEPLAHLVCYMYKISLAIYQPFLIIGKAISGNSDYITYPLFFAIFILISLKLLSYFSRVNHDQKYFLTLFWVYSFFWLVFSGGIVWYGNILLLMGLFAISIFINNESKISPKSRKVLKNSFVGFCIIWLLLGTVVRVSNIMPYQKAEDLGTGLYNPIFYEYATGKLNKSESVGVIYNDIDKAIAKINNESKSKIWKVGTTFSYFINKNNKRIISDNQLGAFKILRKRFPENIDLVNFFRANNIKYIMVDLNTHRLDNTPNKTLTKKFADLVYFVYNNPNMNLIATDRVVGNKNLKGETIYTRNINGEIIQTFGRFAIYEIL